MGAYAEAARYISGLPLANLQADGYGYNAECGMRLGMMPYT
jgi:hypothetical protein